MNLSIAQALNLAQAADAACRIEFEHQLPARLTVAQWALESGWGQHQPGCNCFGIKAYEGCHGTQTLATTEYLHGQKESEPLVFATFPTLYDCFEYRARLITTGHRYADAWELFTRNSDSEQLALNVAKIYATDPQYGSHIVSLMREPVIRAAISTAQQKF